MGVVKVLALVTANFYVEVATNADDSMFKCLQSEHPQAKIAYFTRGQCCRRVVLILASPGHQTWSQIPIPKSASHPSPNFVQR